MKDKKNNKKKKIFFILLIFVILIGIITAYKNKNIISSVIGLSEEALLDADYSAYEEIGQKAYISSVAITETKTGVGPWDDDDEAGNDSSADNNIVRSFDQITWTVENTFLLKDGTSSDESYTGGVIYIEASVPEELANLVEWDLDSMAWAENATVSNDGTKFTGYYTMSETEKTVPGKQNLVLVLQVYNAVNKTEIEPTFSVCLYGNDETDVKNITGDTIYVSAVGRYNIAIAKNGYLDYSGYFDLESGQEVDSLTDTSVRGRMEGYGIVVELYNNDTSKELKGIELPQGDIEFDIILSETLNSNSEALTDPSYIPILWDYRENMSDGNSRILGQKYALGKFFFN